MSSGADSLALHARGTLDSERDLERWFFAGMAILFFITALVGFIPSSVEKVAAVQAGQRPPLPLVLHLHAVLMGSWLSLLVVQSVLVASGRVVLHRTLGAVSFVLLPLLVASMVLMTRSTWVAVAQVPAGAMPPEALAATKGLVTNILIGQLQSIVLFPTFVTWALLVRKTDPDMHKRLMLFATVLPLLAGIDRATMRWGVSTMPASGDSIYLWMLVWIAPALIFDLIRRGRVHRAYVIGLSCVLPCFLAAHFLWGTPTWRAIAPAIMRVVGVSGW